jgi:hypothetical protein
MACYRDKFTWPCTQYLYNSAETLLNSSTLKRKAAYWHEDSMSPYEANYDKAVSHSQNCRDNGSEQIFVNQWICLLFIAAVPALSRHITICIRVHAGPSSYAYRAGYLLLYLVLRIHYIGLCISLHIDLNVAFNRIQHRCCVRASVLVSSVLLSRVQIFLARNRVRRYTFFLFCTRL